MLFIFFCAVGLYALVSLPRMKQLPGLIRSLAQIRLKIPLRQHKNLRLYMYIDKKVVGQQLDNNRAARQNASLWYLRRISQSQR